jgi:hypothetical protein
MARVGGFGEEMAKRLREAAPWGASRWFRAYLQLPQPDPRFDSFPSPYQPKRLLLLYSELSLTVDHGQLQVYMLIYVLYVCVPV